MANNQGNTPVRGIRVPNNEWDRFKSVCDYAGVSMTDVIRNAIREYVDANDTHEEDAGGWSYACSRCGENIHGVSFDEYSEARFARDSACPDCF